MEMVDNTGGVKESWEGHGMEDVDEGKDKGKEDVDEGKNEGEDSEEDLVSDTFS